MIDLLTLRGQIDEIDREIVSLYERRMKISGQVAEYKIETGKKSIRQTAGGGEAGGSQIPCQQ